MLLLFLFRVHTQSSGLRMTVGALWYKVGGHQRGQIAVAQADAFGNREGSCSRS